MNCGGPSKDPPPPLLRPHGRPWTPGDESATQAYHPGSACRLKLKYTTDDHADVHNERETAIEDLYRLLEVARQLRMQLQSCEATYERTAERLKSNTPVSEILQSVEASEARLSLNSRLEELTCARHRSRLSMIAAEVDEGTSISSVGRVWGFSRQMAQRYVQEARTSSLITSHERPSPTV